jgi:predicted dinucleotide-binding enzyme
MPFLFRGRTISKVAVIGSGWIGSDIALHFVKVLHAHDVQVMVDVAEEALAKGKAKLFAKVDKGGETGAFKPNEDVIFEKRGDIVLITIRRPKALNALNSKVFGELERYNAWWQENRNENPSLDSGRRLY